MEWVLWKENNESPKELLSILYKGKCQFEQSFVGYYHIKPLTDTWHENLQRMKIKWIYYCLTNLSRVKLLPKSSYTLLGFSNLQKHSSNSHTSLSLETALAKLMLLMYFHFCDLLKSSGRGATFISNIGLW